MDGAKSVHKVHLRLCQLFAEIIGGCVVESVDGPKII